MARTSSSSVNATRRRVKTRGRGLYEITEEVAATVAALKVQLGIVLLFVPRTTASVVIQERADPTSRVNLESGLTTIVNEADYERNHTMERNEDSPSPIPTAITGVSQFVTIEGGALAPGNCQGAFLWEHRDAPRERVVITRVIEC